MGFLERAKFSLFPPRSLPPLAETLRPVQGSILSVFPNKKNIAHSSRKVHLLRRRDFSEEKRPQKSWVFGNLPPAEDPAEEKWAPFWKTSCNYSSEDPSGNMIMYRKTCKHFIFTTKCYVTPVYDL